MALSYVAEAARNAFTGSQGYEKLGSRLYERSKQELNLCTTQASLSFDLVPYILEAETQLREEIKVLGLTRHPVQLAGKIFGFRPTLGANSVQPQSPTSIRTENTDSDGKKEDLTIGTSMRASASSDSHREHSAATILPTVGVGRSTRGGLRLQNRGLPSDHGKSGGKVPEQVTPSSSAGETVTSPTVARSQAPNRGNNDDDYGELNSSLALSKSRGWPSSQSLRHSVPGTSSTFATSSSKRPAYDDGDQLQVGDERLVKKVSVHSLLNPHSD